MSSLVSVLIPVIAQVTSVYASLAPAGDYDRYVVRFSGPESVRRISVCEQNVRWPCDASGGEFHPLTRANGDAGRSWFASDGAVLLWNGKNLHLKIEHANGRVERQKIQMTQRREVSRGDLSDPHVGDARPNPDLIGKACVWATSPVPRPARDGSRGTTYPSHRTSRDYALRDDTPLYSMGTCETVKRIDTATEHPCGFGIAMRCKLGDEVMGVLYCHLSGPAERKEFFGIGELVGRSGHSGTDNPHLHLGMTYAVYDRDAPRAPGLVDEELLTPGLPVAGNNPDRWLRENGCYKDPRTGAEAVEVRTTSADAAASASLDADWDGTSFQGNDVYDVGEPALTD